MLMKAGGVGVGVLIKAGVRDGVAVGVEVEVDVRVGVGVNVSICAGVLVAVLVGVGIRSFLNSKLTQPGPIGTYADCSEATSGVQPLCTISLT